MIRVFLAELAKDCGSPEKKIVRGLSSTTRDGERRLLVSTLVLVTWEVTRLLVSVTTWIRGVCQHIDTTGKKSSRLLQTLYIQALTFMQFIHVLDPRDHNLTLPCLVSYLVVSLVACVVCLVSRLVN